MRMPLLLAMLLKTTQQMPRLSQSSARYVGAALPELQRHRETLRTGRNGATYERTLQVDAGNCTSEREYFCAGPATGSAHAVRDQGTRLRTAAAGLLRAATSARLAAAPLPLSDLRARCRATPANRRQSTRSAESGKGARPCGGRIGRHIPQGALVLRFAAYAGLVMLAACKGGDSRSPVEAPGADKAARTTTLEAGAAVLQRMPPIGAINAYLDGFHFYNGRMEQQMEAHHYCAILNDDVIQCVIYDG